ncbi:MAG: Sigma-70, region 4 [Nocardioides sp.]|nr:Sigma-70, region 4 [Nocardioides sp.]
MDALGGLPPTRRAVIVLHFYAGMTADEIGHELHLKPSSVRSSLRRSLERLRRKGLAQSTGVTP